MLFVFFVCTGVLWTTVLATDCPSSWVVFQDSCYRFEHQTLTFVEAEQYCRQHNSNLVHIETASENAFLKDFVSYMKEGNWWIGLTDDIIEDNWVWYGTDRTPTFTDWHVGEPNSSHGNEDCVDMHFKYGKWAWNDEACSIKLPAICEMSPYNEVAVVG